MLKTNVDRTIKRTGDSQRFKFGLVLLITGITMAIAYFTAPYAVGSENYSQTGQLIVSALPWVAAIEIALGGYLLTPSRPNHK